MGYKFFDFKLNPMDNFLALYKEAEKIITKDPNAMQLATVNDKYEPSVRTVLYKGMVRDGLSFYTNYESQKSSELTQHNNAGLLFFWPDMDCQIRFEGKAEKLTRAESEAYFKTRPRLSQIGAWASHQSQKINSHEDLERRVEELDKQYHGQEVPCPPHWGGFHLLPLRVEFWFARQGRLHERYVFERKDTKSTSWERYLKSP